MGFLRNDMRWAHFAVLAGRRPDKLFKKPVEIRYIIEAHLHRNIRDIIPCSGQQPPGMAYSYPVYIAGEIYAGFRFK